MAQRKAIRKLKTKTRPKERSLVASVNAADRRFDKLRERVQSAEKAIAKIDREKLLVRNGIAELSAGIDSRLARLSADYEKLGAEFRIMSENIAACVAHINRLQTAEPDSGTRRSSLGKLSDEGAFPVDPSRLARR